VGGNVVVGTGLGVVGTDGPLQAVTAKKQEIVQISRHIASSPIHDDVAVGTHRTLRTDASIIDLSS